MRVKYPIQIYDDLYQVLFDIDVQDGKIKSVEWDRDLYDCFENEIINGQTETYLFEKDILNHACSGHR